MNNWINTTSFMHNPKVTEAILAARQGGKRVGSGSFYIFGKGYFIDVTIWADSYNNNHGEIIPEKGNEEGYIELFKNLEKRRSEYEIYNYVKHIFTIKPIEYYINSRE